MSVSTFFDSFLVASADAVNTTYARSGYGFAPLGCIVWANGRSDSTDAVGSSHLWMSIGYASSTSRRACIVFQSQDAAVTSDTGQMCRNDAVLATISTGDALDGAVD